MVFCYYAHSSIMDLWTRLWGRYHVPQNVFLVIYAPFLRNSPTGQTPRRIFTHDGSNDADSRKDVPFLEIFHIAPHLGGQKPFQKPKFGAWIGVFKPNSRNRKTCILSKPLHRFQGHKDHQMPFVGGPPTCITNPRWRTAAILEKSKNRHISAVV